MTHLDLEAEAVAAEACACLLDEGDTSNEIIGSACERLRNYAELARKVERYEVIIDTLGNALLHQARRRV